MGDTAILLNNIKYTFANVKWYMFSVAWPIAVTIQLIRLMFHKLYGFDTKRVLYRITRGFHEAFASTGVVCLQETFTLQVTLFRLFFGTLSCLYTLIVETSFPKPVLIFRTVLFEYPSVFSWFSFPNVSWSSRHVQVACTPGFKWLYSLLCNCKRISMPI